MGPAEVSDFLKGYAKRQHPAWEQTRWLTDAIYRMLGGEGCKVVFPWEETNASTATDKESEMERVKALGEFAKSLEKKL